MAYLVFDTEAQAIAANNTITENLHLSNNISLIWSNIYPTSDGKFAIAEPPKHDYSYLYYKNGNLRSVSGFTKVESLES